MGREGLQKNWDNPVASTGDQRIPSSWLRLCETILQSSCGMKISKRRVDLELPLGNFGSPSFSQGISAHVFSCVTGISANSLPWGVLSLDP